MRLKHILLAALLLLPLPAFAQSAATPVTPGYLSLTGCKGSVSPCFIPYNAANPQPITLSGSGAAVGTLTVSGYTSLLTATGPTLFLPSSGNTSSVQLAASATFTGAIESILTGTQISIDVSSDQPGTLTIYQCTDVACANPIGSISVPFSQFPGCSPYYCANRAYTINGNYLYLTFQNNGSSTTTKFNLNTYYGTIMPTTQFGNVPVAINEIVPTFGLGFQQLSPLTSATKLSVPPGATNVLLRAEGNNIRFRDDGVSPTASLGQLLATTDLLFQYDGPLSTVSFISVTGNAALDVLFYK